jgi:hypothetical protein
VEAVPEGVGADGRALTFGTSGTARADAQQTLPASRQRSSAGIGRRLKCIVRTKAKTVKCCSLQSNRYSPKKFARPEALGPLSSNGNGSLGFASELIGERDAKNLVCVPASGQVNRL